jgi:hypothetical protein
VRMSCSTSRKHTRQSGGRPVEIRIVKSMDPRAECSFVGRFLVEIFGARRQFVHGPSKVLKTTP